MHDDPLDPGDNRHRNVSGAAPRLPLAAVIFPRLEAADANWIAEMRQAYDPAPSVAIEPHVTLIFPTRLLDAATFVAQVERQSSGMAPFEFLLGGAVAVRDRDTPSTLLYLVPRLGADQIVSLHDRLYTGLLMSALRRDRPYVPHMTVGRFADFAKAEAAAMMLNRQGLQVPSLATEIEVVRIEANAAIKVAQIALAG
jgi:2'-5' RNA ligase